MMKRLTKREFKRWVEIQTEAARIRGRTEKWRGTEMPGIDEKKKYVHVRVRPPRGYHTYRVKDVGEPGGMKATLGIRGYGARRRSEVQKYMLSRRDVGVRRGRLYAKTPRGRRELASLRRKSLASRLLKGY